MSHIKIKKILCPTDFSDPARPALDYAVSLARVFKAELTLLHVVETVLTNSYIVYDEEVGSQVEVALEEEAEKLMDQLRGEIDLKEVKAKLVKGKAFSEIIKAAEEDGTDIIIMGTHGRSGLTHLLIGSTAEKVVRKAPCPVLTVKYEYGEEEEE